MYFITIILCQLVYGKYVGTLQKNETTLISYSLTWEQEAQIIVNKSVIDCESRLILELRFENQTQIDIRIYDEAEEHFQIPKFPPFDYNDIEQPIVYDKYDYTVKVDENPFKLQILRIGEPILTISNLIFSQYYLEFTHIVPTPNLFGLGERNQVGLRFREGIYTLMGRDEPILLEDGKWPGKNVYSSQPVLLTQEKSNNYNILFYKSTVPMDVDYRNEVMKFITIGGIVHLKLFLGDNSPLSCINQYHRYLKGWLIPPFWSFGFHQSRWGYKNGAQLLSVINKYQTNQIPIDIIWSDLDYMHDRQIFSVDLQNFTKNDYAAIKATGTRYVPLLDVAVGVKYESKDKGYAKGDEYDIFLYSPDTGHRFKGYVWPGDSYFPDFLHPNITKYWTEMHHHLHDQVAFDGIWIDMNEPANFCNGECKWYRKLAVDPIKEEYKNDELKLPYLPGNQKLENKTLPSHLKHYGNYLHKDIHNAYGFLDSYQTYLAQKDLGKQQVFILSRSTFAGSGRFAFHWFGDNGATWDFLYLSLGQLFQFQIFGIPMGGADVCGFMLNTNDKLCARWIQLGILYPFFRNHNNDLSINQEFYSLGEQVLLCAQKNVKLRYSLLKWYYTLFKRANGHGSVVNPLFFIFPEDQQTLRDDVMDTQLILGIELMATPILQEGVIRKAYFPQGQWFELLTGLKMEGQIDHMLFNPYNDFVPLFLRQGYALIQQTQNAIRNIKSLNQEYRIIAALTDDLESYGNFLDLDDFENEQDAIAAPLLFIKIKIADNQIQIDITLQDQSIPKSNIIIQELWLYNLNIDQIECKECKILQGFYTYNVIVMGPFQFGNSKIKTVTIQ